MICQQKSFYIQSNTVEVCCPIREIRLVSSIAYSYNKMSVTGIGFYEVKRKAFYHVFFKCAVLQAIQHSFCCFLLEVVLINCLLTIYDCIAEVYQRFNSRIHKMRFLILYSIVTSRFIFEITNNFIVEFGNTC